MINNIITLPQIKTKVPFCISKPWYLSEIIDKKGVCIRGSQMFLKKINIKQPDRRLRQVNRIQ